MSDPKIKLSDGTPLSLAQRYLERALDFYHKKEFDLALSDLEEAILIERRNAELYATRALIHILMGAMDEGLADVKTALKIDPSQWVAAYAAAIHAYLTQAYDQALANLNYAQHYAPLRPEIFIYRAASYYQLGDKASAAREIDSALQVLKPKDQQIGLARKWQALIKDMRG